jgi:hypothetical protein
MYARAKKIPVPASNRAPVPVTRLRRISTVIKFEMRHIKSNNTPFLGMHADKKKIQTSEPSQAPAPVSITIPVSKAYKFGMRNIKYKNDPFLGKHHPKEAKSASTTSVHKKNSKDLNILKFLTFFLMQVPVAISSMASQTTMDTEENLIQLETPVATSTSAQVTASTPQHLELGLLYKQSHAARESANPIRATIFNNDNTVKFESGSMARIGGLDWIGEPATIKTFHGGRIAKGHKVVHENISLSFDPRTLECLGCTSHHSITKQSPFTLILADQNFIPFLTDTEGNCLPIALVGEQQPGRAC